MKLTFPYKPITQNEYPELYAIIEKQKASFGLKSLKKYIWSWHKPWGANAVALSLFGDKMIITEELLTIMCADEMEGIIAHEFSHLYNRDSLKSVSVVILFTLPMITTYFLYNIARFLNVIDNLAIGLILSLMLLVSLPVWLYGYKVANWISVDVETRADRDAVFITSNADALKRGLIKLYNYKFKDDKRPSKLSVIMDSFQYVSEYFIGFTHPRIMDRIENIEFSKKLVEVPKESTAPPMLVSK